MCHLAFIPAGIACTPAMIRGFENSGFSNPDGNGFCMVNAMGTELFTFRSMDLFEATQKFEEMRPQFMGDALWHTRWGTHGETSIRNVHPFRVGTDRDTFLAHNGILPMVTWPSQGEWRSDTNNFAHRTVGSWGSKFDSEAFRAHVEKFIGGSKLVVITVNPAYKKNAYIFNEAGGFWDTDGTWRSNSDHLPSSTKYSKAMGYPRWWELDDECGEACVTKAGKEATGRTVVRKGIDVSEPSRYKFPGQRVLTEADVLAAHGYVPESIDEYGMSDVEVLEPCPNCGSFSGFDSTWRCCTDCRMCGECFMSIADGACTCYQPEWLSRRYNDDKPSVNDVNVDRDYEWSRERPF